MRNWEIKTRSRSCCSCEGKFESGQTYHCLLDMRGEEPFRLDYCARCWREKDLAQSRGNPGTAYWQAAFRLSARSRGDAEPIEKDLVQRLLDKYISSSEPPHVNLCYILALLQERKRILLVRQAGVDEEGNRFTVYEHRERGDTFLVRDPELSLAEAEQVEKEIRILLEGEKNGAGKNEDDSVGFEENNDDNGKESP